VPHHAKNWSADTTKKNGDDSVQILVEDFEDHRILRRPSLKESDSVMNQEEKVFKVDSARVTNVKLVEAKVKPSAIHERLAKQPIGSTKVNPVESDLKN
jgi:hypothetical protein